MSVSTGSGGGASGGVAGVVAGGVPAGGAPPSAPAGGVPAGGAPPSGPPEGGGGGGGGAGGASSWLMTSSRSFTCAASFAFGSFSRYVVKYCFAFSSCFAFSYETATLNRKAGYGLCSYADRKRSAASG